MANHLSDGHKWQTFTYDESEPYHYNLTNEKPDTRSPIGYTLSPWFGNLKNDIADDDYLITQPLIGDINGDLIFFVKRSVGSSILEIDMEYSLNVNNTEQYTDWESVTGSKVTWEVSGTTEATAAGDWFKWDIAENGIYPQMRIAYKNETGSTILKGALIWDVKYFIIGT